MTLGRTLGVAIALGFSLHAYADEAPDMSGRALYLQFCASCHGVSANGKGARRACICRCVSANLPTLLRGHLA